MPIDPLNKPKQKGTGFTNLQSVLQANRPQKLAKTIGAGLQSGIQQSRGAVQSAKSQFGQQLGQNKLGEEGAESQKIQGILNKDPLSVSEEEEQYVGRIGQGYKGPMQLGQVSLSQADEAERLSKTPVGRSAALQKYIGRPGYSSGQRRLDELLLGRAGSEAFKQAKLGAAQVREEKSLAEKDAAEQARAEQLKNERLRSGAQTSVEQQATGLQTGLTQRQAETQQGVQNARNILSRAMAGESISASEQAKALSTLESLGVNINEALPVFAGMEAAQISNFMGAGPRAVTAEDVASEQERMKLARMSALGQKLGLTGEGQIKTLGEKQAYDPFALTDQTKTDLRRQAEDRLNTEQATPLAGVQANTFLANTARDVMLDLDKPNATVNDLYRSDAYKNLQGEDKDTVGSYQNQWRSYTGGKDPNSLSEAEVQQALKAATKAGLQKVMEKRQGMAGEYQRQATELKTRYSPRSIQQLLALTPKAMQMPGIKKGNR